MPVTRKQISDVLHELPGIIPDLDTGSQAILTSRLADALLVIKGLSGVLTGMLDGELYEIRFTAERRPTGIS